MVIRPARPTFALSAEWNSSHAAWRAAIVVPPPTRNAEPRSPGSLRPGRRSWAELLRRVFAVDALVCPRCAGPRRRLGAVTEPHAVRQLLAALGLAAEPPPRPGAAVWPL